MSDGADDATWRQYHQLADHRPNVSARYANSADRSAVTSSRSATGRRAASMADAMRGGTGDPGVVAMVGQRVITGEGFYNVEM
jgi:hypothetical protein